MDVVPWVGHHLVVVVALRIVLAQPIQHRVGGLSFIVAEAIKLLFGNFPVDYHVPAQLDGPAFTIGSQQYPLYRLLMGGVALVMFAALYLLLTRTRVGIIVRSAIYKPRMVEALGHNVQRVFMGVFGVGAALAGLAIPEWTAIVRTRLMTSPLM